MSSSSRSRSFLRSLLTVAGLAAMVGGAGVAPALADDWHHGRDSRWEQQRHDEQRHEEWRAHEWREHHRYYRDRAPDYYYAPPPVVYAPPPPPAVHLFFPFSFR